MTPEPRGTEKLIPGEEPVDSGRLSDLYDTEQEALNG